LALNVGTVEGLLGGKTVVLWFSSSAIMLLLLSIGGEVVVVGSCSTVVFVGLGMIASLKPVVVLEVKGEIVVVVLWTMLLKVGESTLFEDR
jgi:hypothetical protein